MTNILEEATIAKRRRPQPHVVSSNQRLGRRSCSRCHSGASHVEVDAQALAAGAGSTFSGGDHLDAQRRIVAARQLPVLAKRSTDAQTLPAGAGLTVEGAATRTG
jgi:hypothetical protein